MKYFKILIILMLVGSYANAQTYTGCYVESSGKIYTDINSNGKYKKNSGILIGEACPSGSTSPCTVTNGGGNGEVGDFSILNCPLDTDVWVLILSSASIGSFFIYRKQRLGTV